MDIDNIRSLVHKTHEAISENGLLEKCLGETAVSSLASRTGEGSGQSGSTALDDMRSLISKTHEAITENGILGKCLEETAVSSSANQGEEGSHRSGSTGLDNMRSLISKTHESITENGILGKCLEETAVSSSANQSGEGSDQSGSTSLDNMRSLISKTHEAIAEKGILGKCPEETAVSSSASQSGEGSDQSGSMGFDNIRSLMHKTHEAIAENGFLGKCLEKTAVSSLANQSEEGSGQSGSTGLDNMRSLISNTHKAITENGILGKSLEETAVSSSTSQSGEGSVQSGSMDLDNIQNFMRKAREAIAENCFLGKCLEETAVLGLANQSGEGSSQSGSTSLDNMRSLISKTHEAIAESGILGKCPEETAVSSRASQSGEGSSQSGSMDLDNIQNFMRKTREAIAEHCNLGKCLEETAVLGLANQSGEGSGQSGSTGLDNMRNLISKTHEAITESGILGKSLEETAISSSANQSEEGSDQSGSVDLDNIRNFMCKAREAIAENCSLGKCLEETAVLGLAIQSGEGAGQSGSSSLDNMRSLISKTHEAITENGILGKCPEETVNTEGVRAMMESALTARDRVGVQDFVLLENYTSEAAFIENLRKRFKENLIYTYIGSVLVSVNPYKELEIYSKQHMERYRGVNFYEVSPHIYAVSDNSYRSMRTERKDQCILISGESGAGKTEASKKILQYYAFTCPASDHVQTVKDRLLQSNPVLEAFGNAKTLRNDNSSRFGKYMDIQFDFKGAPVGGHILNYLLEKSRVVHQSHGERNFHIFYQLLEGGEEDLLRRLGLERNALQYQYLVKGNCPKVSSVNDRSDWKAVRKALTVIGFTEDEVEELLNIIASVLHLGNIQYGGDEGGNAFITTETQIKYLAKLVGVEGPALKEALTHKKIIAKGEELMSPLNLEQAASARDALSKAIYGRTFTWLVNKINGSLAFKDEVNHTDKSATVIGLLDIYGFEVFQHNSFEQFCINYCNEKLQQLFIELTLKSEQEEYESEGITWEPVQYFNNKIICDLVEEKFKGMIAILDEECLRPGDASDVTFLEKLEDTVGGHPHFVTHKLADGKTRKVLGREEFRLLHYAGEVNYNVNGFLDKNNDLLFRNLKEVVCLSENKILNQCFEREELTGTKRPETTATQFKASLAKLMEILMSKEPSYIRCIKPNDAKQSARFDEVLIRHQVKYLGLMENLRVRRAGFAYRRRYEAFLQRYKPLCPETWPNWHGKLADGVSTLVKHLGYKPEEYKLGRSKIFIRFPKTLFATEDALEAEKHGIATILQKTWRGYSRRSKFLKMKHAAIVIQSCWRGYLARRKAKQRREAANTIRRFIKGFIYRHEPRCPENEYFLDYVRYSFLMKLRRNLPKSVLDKSWPTPPPALQEASEQLQSLCMRNMVWSYCKRIQPEWKSQMEQKVVASEIFKDKKDNYPQSVPKLFVSTRLNSEDINPKVLQVLGNDHMKYCVAVTKYDRNGYRARPRQLLLTATFAVIVEEAKLKQRIEYTDLKGVSVSSLSDGLFVLHVPSEDNKQKGDVVLQCDHVIEALTKLAICADKINNININQGSIKFTRGQGKEGIIDFTAGSELLIAKAKNGHLSVTAPRLNSR